LLLVEVVEVQGLKKLVPVEDVQVLLAEADHQPLAAECL
jgi:hypothetical protein